MLLSDNAYFWIASECNDLFCKRQNNYGQPKTIGTDVLNKPFTATLEHVLTEVNSKSNLLLFLDFDGTLVEIAPQPSMVEVSPLVLTLLTKISSRIPTYLISGRTLDELQSYIYTDHIGYSAEHGAIHAKGKKILYQEHVSEPVETMAKLITSSLGECADDILELKTSGLALHYRRHESMKTSLLSLANRVIEPYYQRFSLLKGKKVYEIRSRSVNKGRAIAWWMSQCKSPDSVIPVFIGDDKTDEDGFSVVNRIQGVSVHVGNNAETKAKFRLKNVDSVHSMLGSILKNNEKKSLSTILEA